jgi:REP element-mobilizing transposase RayT
MTLKTKALPKTARTDAHCSYSIAFSTYRFRPVLTAEMHGLITDCLGALERKHGLTIVHRSVTPSTIVLRVNAPATDSPMQIVGRIKTALHRYICAAHPEIRKRMPSLFTLASWVRTVGNPSAEGPTGFFDRERGAHNAT